MRRLVLFDIDGTILHGGRFFRECFERAMRSRHGDVSFPRITFSGKTDRQICRELMQAAGLETTEETISEVIHDYLERVRESVVHRMSEVRLLPGVAAVVRHLDAHPDVVLGLLTGNVREGAKLKLSAVGLHAHFRFGVFGDDHWDRYQLPAIAVERAHREFGRRFEGKEIVIIGDTIHDVSCGRSLGVRAIGVGTGQAEQRELVIQAGPDYFFEDMSDLDAVVRAILEERA